MSDSELREQLERRRKSAPLDHVQRAQLIEAIHSQVVASEQSRRQRFGWRLLSAATVVAAAGIVVVLAFPRISSPPTASSSTGTGRAGIVLSTKQLVAIVAARDSIGDVVLADTRFGPDLRLDRCAGQNPCFARVLADTDPPLQVDLAEYLDAVASDQPTVMAFRIQDGYVTFLGQASVKDAETAWGVSDVMNDTALSGVLFAVDGWLVSGMGLPCPPPTSGLDDDFYCSNTWLANEKAYMPEFMTQIAGAMHVQANAYDNLAPNPTHGPTGAEPRRGTYLVRHAACPAGGVGACPLWEIVARVGGTAPSPTETPTPSLSPTDGATKIWTVPELVSLAPPDASDETYAVHGWLMQTPPAPCAAPPNMSAPQDYWCGGSWITSEATTSGDGGGVTLTIPGALHVQWDAYDQFAPDPQKGSSEGVPREGTYLVSPAGCPTNVMGDCPVWKLVGRVDSPMPVASGQTPEPNPVATAMPTQVPVDGIVYDGGGVPIFIDGQRVYEGSEIGDAIAASTDASPLLIAVRATSDRPLWPYCPHQPNFNPHLLCGGGQLFESLKSSDAYRLIVVSEQVVVSDMDLISYPDEIVVLRVHTHDPDATSCADLASKCEQAVVLDEVRWLQLSVTPTASSIVCVGVNTETCVQIAEAVRGWAHPEIAQGAALLIDWDCPPGAWCAALGGYIAVEVVPGWTDPTQLRGFAVSPDVRDPSTLLIRSYSASLPQFIVDELPLGGPWPTVSPSPTLP
jgi:hypothetical protein